MENLIITSLICNCFCFYAIYLLKKEFEQDKQIFLQSKIKINM
jgi:hypothetical protein